MQPLRQLRQKHGALQIDGIRSDVKKTQAYPDTLGEVVHSVVWKDRPLELAAMLPVSLPRIS